LINWVYHHGWKAERAIRDFVRLGLVKSCTCRGPVATFLITGEQLHGLNLMQRFDKLQLIPESKSWKACGQLTP
jgi:hypothetical protein